FYGSEARAYALATFLVPLSTVALLSALESRRLSWWWGLYFVAATAAAYTHYSVIFILFVQVAWVLWRYRERWRTIALVNAAVVLAYLPWLPNVRRNPEIFFAEENHPFTLAEFGQTIREVLPGRTLLQLSEVPGRLAMLLLALAGAAIVGGLLLAYSEKLRGAPGRAREWLPTGMRSRLSLLVLILVATPAGIAAYSAIETSLLAPRNLLVALPYACVLVGILLTAIRRPLAVGAAALCVVALFIGSVRSVDDTNRRAPFNAAADVVQERISAGTPVLQFPSFAGLMEGNLFPDLDEHPLRQDLALYLPADYQEFLRQEEWPDAETVLVVGPSVDVIDELYDELAARNDARLAERTILPGVVPIAIREYRSTGD
ncbi:MAG: hypothetical protein ACR2N5_00055, partial [Solirubrobacterales bacterium]